MEFGERHVIGDRDQADDHRAHLAQNRSQNQAFEGGCFSHLSRLLGSPDPRLFDALQIKIVQIQDHLTLVTKEPQADAVSGFQLDHYWCPVVHEFVLVLRRTAFRRAIIGPP